MTALTDSSAGAGGTAMSVGQLLRTRRIERGLNINDIAAETRIPVRYLNAIEDDQHESLPALPFAVGFVRNYAKVLGLSPELVCAQFKAETSRLGSSEHVSFPEPLDESRIPSFAWIGGGLLAAIVVGCIWWLWTSNAPAEEATVPATVTETAELDPSVAAPAVTDSTDAASTAAPGDTTASPTQVDPNAPVSSPADPNAAAIDKAEAQAAAAARVLNSGPVVIRAVEDSWVKISDGVSGSVKIGIMRAGETYQVPALPNLKLMTGNAGAIEISVGGQVLPPLGGRGEVVKNVGLQPDELRAFVEAKSGGASE